MHDHQRRVAPRELAGTDQRTAFALFVGTAFSITALPEVLRLAPTWRLVIYGCLLLVIVIRSPEGLESLLRRLVGRAARRAS